MTTLTAPLPTGMRELTLDGIDQVEGGFICGGVCVGIAIAGSLALLGGGIYLGWQAAHNRR